MRPRCAPPMRPPDYGDRFVDGDRAGVGVVVAGGGVFVVRGDLSGARALGEIALGRVWRLSLGVLGTGVDAPIGGGSASGVADWTGVVGVAGLRVSGVIGRCGLWGLLG